MEGYPYVQAPTTSNPQDATMQSQHNPIIPNVNGNQLVHPYSTESLVPPLPLPSHVNRCETSISNTLTESLGDRANSFVPGVPASADIYTPSPHSTPIATCACPQPYVPPTPPIAHFGGGLEHIYHPTAHPTRVLDPQHVPYPAPIVEPLMPSNACTLSDIATSQPHIDLPPVPVPTLVQPAKMVEDPPRSVENLVDSVGVPSVEKPSNEDEQKQIRVEIEDPEGISAKVSNAPPLGEQDSREISCDVAVSTENSADQNIKSSPPAESGKVENNGLDDPKFIEESLPGALKSTVTEVEAPKQDCERKNPVEERGKGEGMFLPDKQISTIVEPDPPNEERDGNSPAMDCDKEHLADVPVAQQVPNDVSCLLKNAVLVQAVSFEPVEPVEDVKPVVGGCIDDIGRVDESQENVAIESAELFVDETGDGPDYDAMDGIEVAKMDPIVPLEVPFFNSNEMIDDVDDVAAGSESEEEPFEPDMTECGEMIGLATDDELELKRSMCANTVSRAKKESIESQSKRGVSIVKEENKTENGTKYGLDKISEIPPDKRSKRPTKKRKIHSIRIVDIKKEVLNIDEQNSEDSSENYASKRIITKKSKKASSSSDIPYGSGFDSSCEEILDDDCLHDGLETQSKGSRCSNNVAPRVNKRKAKKVEVIAGLKIPAHQQQQLQNLVLKKKQTTRDRFYDRSQDIPNDIYFENMNVPLHILHDTSSSSSDEEHSAVSKYRHTNYSAHRNRNSSSSVGRSETNHISLQSMKMFLKIAGFRHVRYQKLWKDCHTNQERAEAILRFLQDSGLQGEPTFEKCSELRKQIQLENEAKALDVSVIISAGEGRVTRQRTKMLTNTSTPATSEKQKNSETEQLQTPSESISQSGDETAECYGEQNVEIEQQGTSQPEAEPTKCHNDDDKEIGQQTVQPSASHSENEPTKSHTEQDSKVPQKMKAAEETAKDDNSENNQVLQSEK